MTRSKTKISLLFHLLKHLLMMGIPFSRFTFKYGVCTTCLLNVIYLRDRGRVRRQCIFWTGSLAMSYTVIRLEA